MKKTLVLLCLLAGFTASANPIKEANQNGPVCYGREYSEKHMLSNEAQSVKSFRMKFFKDELSGDSDVALLDIEANIKTKTEVIEGESINIYNPYSAGMYCMPNGTKSTNILCTIDCDGGSAEVSWEIEKKGDEIIFHNKGFVLQGGCGEEEKLIFLDAKKGGDDVFKLYRLRKEFCQK